MPLQKESLTGAIFYFGQARSTFKFATYEGRFPRSTYPCSRGRRSRCQQGRTAGPFARAEWEGDAVTSSVGQLILTGVPGKELDPETARLFRAVQPGGFILFGRNIESAPQLRKLIDDLRDLSEIEPIITIDQEGGRVSRLRLIGNEPPNAQQLREKRISILSAGTATSPDDCCACLVSISIFVPCSTFPSMTTPIIRCAVVVTEKRWSRSFAMPAPSTTGCASRGSPAAANIFPVFRRHRRRASRPAENRPHARRVGCGGACRVPRVLSRDGFSATRSMRIGRLRRAVPT